MSTTGVYIGALFRYHEDMTIDGCLNCTVPVELCTGGDGVCPEGCQFYKPPKPRTKRLRGIALQSHLARVRRDIHKWWEATK